MENLQKKESKFTGSAAFALKKLALPIFKWHMNCTPLIHPMSLPKLPRSYKCEQNTAEHQFEYSTIDV